jgi:hypothetical protein
MKIMPRPRLATCRWRPCCGCGARQRQPTAAAALLDQYWPAIQNVAAALEGGAVLTQPQVDALMMGEDHLATGSKSTQEA